MAYLKGKIDLLAQLVDRHQGANKTQVLERLGGKLGLSEAERRMVQRRVQAMGNRRFSFPVSAHGATHAAGRDRNEDALLIDRRRRLFAVADGMGGHRGGELAASTALQALADNLDRGLKEAFDRANAAVMRAAAKRAPGMGCTLSAVWLANNHVRMAYVGDSRIYKHMAGRLIRVSQDQRLGGHVLWSVVGRETMAIQTVTERAADGTAYLLVTDGVTDVIGDEQLLSLVAVGRKALAGAPGRIIAAARAAKTCDNATAVVVRIG